MFRIFYYNPQNNAVLNGIKSMPAKDSTSDSTADFSLSRHTYYQTNTSELPTNAQLAQKKWVGGNRDASQVISNRRVANIGVGSMNAANGPNAFVTKRDNSQIHAYNRVRNSGYCVPPKVRQQPYSSQLYQF